jgi:hypothetical protein
MTGEFSDLPDSFPAQTTSLTRSCGNNVPLAVDVRRSMQMLKDLWIENLV